MRIVVDANVLASGIFWGGYPGRVLDLWAHDRVAILASPAILCEYSRVLTDLGSREGQTTTAGHWLTFIGQHSTLVDPRTVIRMCRDPDDDKYLACAVDGGAECIVSGDRDLLELKSVLGVPIVTPRRFIENTASR